MSKTSLLAFSATCLIGFCYFLFRMLTKPSAKFAALSKSAQQVRICFCVVLIIASAVGLGMAVLN